MSAPSTPSRPKAPLPDVSLACPVDLARLSADNLVQAATHGHSLNPDVLITAATPQRATPLPSSSRGRLTPRYPSRLARGEPGRVPLHKRGTSRTYERLEDLLREAGYKETKIYSPEVERTEARREGRRDASARGGMGAVVDFITGLMPGSSKSEIGEASNEEEEIVQRSPPPSPLAGKRVRKPLSPPVEDLSDTPSSLGSFRRRYGQMPYSLSPTPRNDHFLKSSASGSLRPHGHLSAQGYLRHIASTPNISRARKHSASPGRSRLQFVAGEQPPLPSGWFDSVTRAVLGSSSSVAHVGGPSHIDRHHERPTRATKENRPVPHSVKNKVRPVTGYLRAETAPGAVNTVRVVCRSAPASRSSSRVGDKLSAVSDKGKSRDSSRPTCNKSRSSQSDVPTLASTRIENDAWSLQWLDGERVASNISDDDYSDEEDEGELDLARMLVPPKRQKSIRSLRQHLHKCESARALRGNSLRPLEPWAPHDDDEEPRRSTGPSNSKSRSGSIEDGLDEYGPAWNLHGNPYSGSKRRRNLPGTWSSRNVGKA